MEFLQEDIDYFNLGELENSDFWSRFGGMPNFEGQHVLDLGCGHGRMCVDIAAADASRVVGVDLDEHRITFAKEYTRLHYPHLANRLEFLNIDIEDYDGPPFDHMVSKSTFEHVIRVEEVLAEMKKRLKPGGKIFLGFGPLYYSPFGDHGWTKSRFPWGHVFQTDSMIVNRLNRGREDKISTIYDLGLNKMAPADFRREFAESGMKVLFYGENLVMPSASNKRRMAGRVVSVFRRIPFLEKYFTVNIFCLLENTGPVDEPVLT
jgi:ubiquinone/menaquinone biosynthesis C-methylase UbiE